MRVLLIFSGLLFLLGSTLKAQNAEFELLNTDNGIVPYQQYVKVPFQFLINDEVQSVLTNPARLNSISERKIYTTLQENDVTRRFLYVHPSKWFVRAFFNFDESNSISNESIISTNNDNSISENIQQSRVITLNSSYNISRDVEKIIGDVEFQRLIQSKENSGIAVGLRLAGEKIELEELYVRNRNNNDQAISTGNGILNSSNQEVTQRDSKDDTKDNRNRFLAEIKLSGYNETWNWVQSLTVQHGDFQSNEIIESTFDLTSISRDGNETITEHYLQNSVLNTAINSDKNPLLLGYHGAFSKRINWIGSDYMIGSIQLNYAFGEVDLGNTSLDTSVETDVLTNDIEISRSVYSTAEISNTKEYLADFMVSTGYAIEVASNGLHLFTGLLPQFNYSKTENHFYNRYLGISKVTQSLFVVDIQLPIVAELELNNWVTLFGGGNMSTIFSKRDSKQATIVPSLIEYDSDFAVGRTIDDSSIRSSELDSEYDRVQFSQFTFLGLKASHSSGIQLYADIGSDVSTVTAWRFTIGYHF